MGDGIAVTWIALGEYRVEHDGRSEIVFVAGAPGDRWASCGGRIFRENELPEPRGARGQARALGAHSLTAPMAATIVKVLVAPGASVKKGDTVIVLEAMKMELPIRAPADATVTRVNGREGELVQPDTPLIELE